MSYRFLSYLACSKSASVHPPVRPGYDDKYRSGSYRFVERQKLPKMLPSKVLGRKLAAQRFAWPNQLADILLFLSDILCMYIAYLVFYHLHCISYINSVLRNRKSRRTLFKSDVGHVDAAFRRRPCSLIRDARYHHHSPDWRPSSA